MFIAYLNFNQRKIISSVVYKIAPGFQKLESYRLAELVNQICIQN